MIDSSFLLGVLIGFIFAGILFFFKDADIMGGWEVVYYKQTGWKVYDEGSINNKYCSYRILRKKTESRDRFRLTMSGYKPHEHNVYERLNREVIKLNNGSLTLEEFLRYN